MMISPKLLLLSFLVIACSLHAEYILKESERETSRIDKMPKNTVADMKNIPQDPFYYARQIKPFSKQEQLKLDRRYNEMYFKPWDLHTLDIPEDELGWEERFVTKKPIYKENGDVIPPAVYEKWLENAAMSEVNSKKYKAITIRRTNVKALPTENAFYRDPHEVGEGFPFDYNQNSAYHINVPLFISHFSKDKRWAFVRGAYAFGWIDVRDLALVNDNFIKTFKNNNYAITIKDNLRIFNDAKPYSLVKLGALFPVAKDGKHYLIASRNEKGQASIAQLSIDTSDFIAKKPLDFTSDNVAKVAREFYSEPYGWGGSYECRDCSATTRDFMGVFGIFLPRNSSKQALEGIKIPIIGLDKPFKKQKIIQEAKPFRSLLYVPGHIVLYMGEYKGEPVIMHTYWGIRKNDMTKLITGRTIITTTEPGKERSDTREESKLINTLQTIVTFD